MYLLLCLVIIPLFSFFYHPCPRLLHIIFFTSTYYFHQERIRILPERIRIFNKCPDFNMCESESKAIFFSRRIEMRRPSNLCSPESMEEQSPSRPDGERSSGSRCWVEIPPGKERSIFLLWVRKEKGEKIWLGQFREKGLGRLWSM